MNHVVAVLPPVDVGRADRLLVDGVHGISALGAASLEPSRQPRGGDGKPIAVVRLSASLRT